MKKILIILGETILTVAGTVNLISCENKKNNSFTINKPNLQPNKKDTLKIKMFAILLQLQLPKLRQQILNKLKNMN